MNKGKMVRVSSKGQIVLPKSIRVKMGIDEGDYLVLHELREGVLVVAKRPETWLECITKELRDEVEATGFTREDLEVAIEAVRRKRRSNAA